MLQIQALGINGIVNAITSILHLEKQTLLNTEAPNTPAIMNDVQGVERDCLIVIVILTSIIEGNQLKTWKYNWLLLIIF